MEYSQEILFGRRGGTPESAFVQPVIYSYAADANHAYPARQKGFCLKTNNITQISKNVKYDEFVKVQYLRYDQFLSICGLRLVDMHVRQVRCIFRNRASLDLDLFTKPSDRDLLRVHQV